jgi:signal transduction histidine kinase
VKEFGFARERNLPAPLPRSTGSNSQPAKYSGGEKFEVNLTQGSNEIQLRVRDSGIGFNAGTTNGHGLGLTSMKERLKLVNGRLSIDSRPQNGTTVLACVPLDAQGVSSNSVI